MDDNRYINADLSVDGGGLSIDGAGEHSLEESTVQTDNEIDDDVAMELEEVKAFDGVKGVVQKQSAKDLTYAVAFVLHFGITIWWFVDSFIPVTYYNGYTQTTYTYMKTNHLGLFAFVTTTGLAGCGLALLTFVWLLRHGETALKTTIVSSLCMCLGVGVLGLFMGEFFMCSCGFGGFVIVAVYANLAWARVKFTAINLSVAITAIRENMGLFLAALHVVVIGFIWLSIATIAAVSAHRTFGNWTFVYTLFSYYWTQQVLSNIVSVVTAGMIGRWVVFGECTRNLSIVLKHTLGMVRTSYFGCICYGSLYYGIAHTLSTLSSFLSSKRIPLLPRFLNLILRIMHRMVGHVNEWAYVYIGMYGYSYRAAARNTVTLLENKGWDRIIKYKLAGNIMFMANVAIGLLTGFSGLLFSTLEYGIMRKSGMSNPSSDGFLIGFLVGFLFSSIMLSIVTSTMHTVIVCLAESPVEFKANHGNLSTRLESAWKIKAKKTMPVF